MVCDLTITVSMNRPDYDFDLDGSVTPADFAHAASCLSGPGAWPTPPAPATGDECLWGADFDGDADVDMADFAVWQTLVG